MMMSKEEFYKQANEWARGFSFEQLGAGLDTISAEVTAAAFEVKCRRGLGGK